MLHYIDIRLRLDPEVPAYQLMNGLYTRLHRALVQLGTSEIGVSFPAHDENLPCLGSHMRLHGNAATLQNLMDRNWLKGFQDHIDIRSIQPVPSHSLYRQVSRVQVKSNADRLRRRAIKRHGFDTATAVQKIPDAIEKFLKLPFVTLSSCSTGQASFPLFIRHGPLSNTFVTGFFSSYGLSQHGMIPWF